MFLKKIIIIFFLGMGLFFTACEDTLDLNLNENPNFSSPDSANLDALYGSVQVNFAQFFNGGDPNHFSINDFTMMMSRQRAFTVGSDYANAFTPSIFDNMWKEVYSDFMPDADEIINKADEVGLPFHGGTTKILKAYVLMTMVDVFGDVPLSEANAETTIFSPAVDAGVDVYTEAERLLDEGISDLNTETSFLPLTDNFFNGSVEDWINAAKSIKIKLYVSTKLVNPNAATNLMKIISDEDFVPTNFYFHYTSNRAIPDSRHPFYIDSYETVEGDYQSNWLMWVMSEEKSMVDPRIRGYFYRQVDCIHLDDENKFACVFSSLPDPSFTPQHYLDCDENMPYCVGSLSHGYYGRDHGNSSGVPPDGDIRTVYGVYPAGGKFDNNTFYNVLNSGTDGGLGAGVLPLIPANFIKFYRAEAALTMGTGEDARLLLEQAVRESIDNVIDFIKEVDPTSLDEIGSTVFTVFSGRDFLPADTTITAYVNEVLSLYDASSDKLDVVMKEFLISSFGNGIEGYNMLRRTGKPFNVQPMIQPTAGSFIRSALYPAVHTALNENANQKEVTKQVFWDTNPPDFIK